MLNASQLEQPLTENERILRDSFVSEYLKDFNAYQAAVRLGFQPTFAVEWAQRLFGCGYVQRKIQYMTRSCKVHDDEMRAINENRLLQIAQNGSDTASVAAIRELNAMKGWSKGDGLGEDAATALTEVFKDLAQRLPA